MGREPIENEYFNWLCAKVLNGTTRSYYTLLGILYSTEFIWVQNVPGDKNRLEDGLELRQDFLREAFLKRDSVWEGQPCSVFEVLLAFANRASFQTDIPVRDWFWKFMANLHLDQFRQVTDSDIPIIDFILNTFIWRTYDEYGNGGLFPLSQTHNDQRELELWFQFFEYTYDRGLL